MKLAGVKPSSTGADPSRIRRAAGKSPARNLITGGEIRTQEATAAAWIGMPGNLLFGIRILAERHQRGGQAEMDASLDPVGQGLALSNAA